ncbi:hypothetical protein MY4824_000422 [Beauveria thailandica]
MSSPSSLSELPSGLDLQNRKRPNTDNTTQDNPPNKRLKSTSAIYPASNFPPKFWDNLSKVWLTRRALRELDRRNGCRRNDAQPPATISAGLISASSPNIARFARRGGPDLSHLRGCPEPRHTAQMNPYLYSEISRQSTKSKKVKRSSAYDKGFEQDLIDHSIYPQGFRYSDHVDLIPEPSNLEDIYEALAAPRESLSPTRISHATFKQFQIDNNYALSESVVVADILPAVLGNARIPCARNLHFNNLASLTDGVTVNAVPDLYDGSHPVDINIAIRQELNKTIVPSSHHHAPATPNFFLEAKSPSNGIDVAKRQACLDGALGARAMHSLQNYGEDKPIYDGNAYAFSAIYHSGQLVLYAHHMTGPTARGGRVKYHMTQLKGFLLTGDRETFIRGATAVRNMRDYARQQRNMLIQKANARVPPSVRVSVEEHPSEVQRSVEEQPSEVRNGNALHTRVCHWEIKPSSQDSHRNLQQKIAETIVEVYEDSDSSTPTHQYNSDESQDPARLPAATAVNDPCIGSVSSLGSNHTTDTKGLKRARQASSSPTGERRLSGSRTC